MTRLAPIDPATAPAELAPLFAAGKAALGAVPNLLRAMGNSPAALEGFLGLYAGLSKGALDHATREALALAVSEANGCAYCRSAHTAISRHVGLSNEAIVAARDARATDPKLAAMLRFARLVNDQRGQVSDVDVAALRQAGVTDAEFAELLGAVAVNFYTNIFAIAAKTPIDFPVVPPLAQAA